MQATVHPFDQALALTPQPGTSGPGLFDGQTSPAYANMIGPFGGVTAATLLAAVWQHPQRLGEPIALTVNFAAPIADGGYQLDAQPLRTNRSTQHWLVLMRQQGQVVASATVVTALRRTTWSSVEAGCPQMPAPDTLPVTPSTSRVAWTSRYAMRFAKGSPQLVMGAALAASAAGNWAPGQHTEPRDVESLQWIRDEPPRRLDFMALAAYCDVFFPRIFLRRASWVPVGTVSLSINFHTDAAQLARLGDAAVIGHARAHQFRDGFFDQSAEIWGAGGELLAVSHQMVYYKE